MFYACSDVVLGRTGVRATGSPAFLRLKCYRYLEHVGTYPDFEAGYRSREEYERWFARDCVITQRSRLLEAGIPENDVKAVEIQVDRQIEEGLQAARLAPFPPLGELYRGVFMRRISFCEALNEAMTQEMERDPRVFVYGIGVPDHKEIFEGKRRYV